MDGFEVCSFKTKQNQELSLSWCLSTQMSLRCYIPTYLCLNIHRMLPIWREEGSNFIEIYWHSLKKIDRKLSTEKGMGQKLHKFMDVLRCIKLFRSMENLINYIFVLRKLVKLQMIVQMVWYVVTKNVNPAFKVDNVLSDITAKTVAVRKKKLKIHAIHP